MAYDNTGAGGERIPQPCRSGVHAFERYFGAVWGLPSLGCYNPASTLPGGGPSLHTVGRAVDIGHDWSDEKIALVWELCRQLVGWAPVIGVQQIIYRGFFWRQGQLWKMVSASTDPHESHAHVEFTIAAADSNTYQTYADNLEGPPMTPADIDALSTAIVDKWWAKLLDVHSYDANTDVEAPASTVASWALAELSQIRSALTAK